LEIAGRLAVLMYNGFHQESRASTLPAGHFLQGESPQMFVMLLQLIPNPRKIDITTNEQVNPLTDIS